MQKEDPVQEVGFQDEGAVQMFLLQEGSMEILLLVCPACLLTGWIGG